MLINADTKAPFSYKDACIELNPHVGGNPTTAKEARKAVSEFLQALFKLGLTTRGHSGMREAQTRNPRSPGRCCASRSANESMAAQLSFFPRP